MKTVSLTAAGLLVAVFALPVLAEPASFKQLSIHANNPASDAATSVQVVKTAGMEKYGPYRGRFTDLNVDTEIAVFEEVGAEERGYTKAVRSDRIPSM
ncbi:MAG: hypothetical protein M0Q95_06645 [Porticoccaceae bacterium]|nr:hypothetical protein [Porticoccaceae bacterium]